MKIRLYCDSGANIHSKRQEIIKPEDWGMTEDEWTALTEEEKESMVKDWAFERLYWGWEEQP